MTRSYVGHDSFISGTWLIHMWDMTLSDMPQIVCAPNASAITPEWCVGHDSFIRVTWLIHVCDMTHSYVRHDSFIRVTWLIHTCDMNHSYVWHNSSVCVTQKLGMHSVGTRLKVCDMTDWHDSFTSVAWLIHICDMIWWDRNVGYVSMARTWLCVTWLIHMCAVTHLCVTQKRGIRSDGTHLNMCDMTHSYVCRDSSMCDTETWDTFRWHALVYVWHDSFICVPWLMYVWHRNVGYVPMARTWKSETMVRGGFSLHLCFGGESYICVYIYIYIYMYAYTHTLSRSRIHIHARAHAHSLAVLLSSLLFSLCVCVSLALSPARSLSVVYFASVCGVESYVYISKCIYTQSLSHTHTHTHIRSDSLILAIAGALFQLLYLSLSLSLSLYLSPSLAPSLSPVHWLGELYIYMNI